MPALTMTIWATPGGGRTIWPAYSGRPTHFEPIDVDEQRALKALKESGLSYQIVRHGPVRSLAEAAAARGVEPAAVVKTIVVRRGDDDYLFVLVPGDRAITPFGALRAWPVVADERIRGRRVSIGAGAHGVSASVDGTELVSALDATAADVTEPEG